jgi:aspartyl-tRNA(Asn)/glutamyl-tRNA(Gln) amidotransferase subunit A
VKELLDGPGWAISEAVRSRQVSATDIARAALERVSADTLGAVWTVTEERALREAAAVDAAVAAGRIPSDRVLLGVPVG